MRFTLLIFVIFLMSCSSIEKREAVRVNDSNKSLPAIDDMIVTHKKEYIERCYMPVIKKIASNSPRPCETALQQSLERRYSLNFTQEHVDAVADELFFTDMRERVVKKLREEPSLRRAAGKRFSSVDEMMVYYQSRYTFRKPES